MDVRSRLLVLCAGAALAAPGILPAAERPVELSAPDAPIVSPVNAVSLNRLTLLALSGTPYKLGGFLPAFDRRLDTFYEAREAGPAQVNLVFAKAQTLHSVRLRLGNSAAEWSLGAADSAAELASGAGSFRQVILPRRTRADDRIRIDDWDEARLTAPVTARAFRLTVTPGARDEPARVHECNLMVSQTLEAISLKSASNAVELGEPTPLEVSGYFSGGDTRLISARGLQWRVVPENAARMTSHNRLYARRRGAIQVRVSYGKLASPPLSLEVVDSD